VTVQQTHSGSPNRTNAYRPDIDGLRSIAVLLVLVFHFDLFGIGKAGFIGVDVFFVISGYLISSIIWKQLESGRFTLRSFYLRRFRRLAPAFVCVQVLLLVCAYFVLLPNDVVELIRQTFFAQTYLINFYLWRSVNYFGLQADSVPLLHCWSLAVEEQFYLTYPLLLMSVHRFARKRLLLVLVTVTVASFALNVGFVMSHPWATFYLLPTRAWELSLGALIPFAQPWFQRRAWSRQVAAGVGTTAIALGVTLYAPTTPFPGIFALYPTVGAAALILSGSGGSSFASLVLSKQPFVYIGRISYSLYLVHWPLRVVIDSVVFEYGLFWRWTSFLLSLALSALLFHTVEDPLRRGVVFATGRRFASAYAIGFAAIMLVALTAHRTGGWTHRFVPAATTIASYEKDQNESARHCEYFGPEWSKTVQSCRLGATKAPQEWLLFGDSHAWALSESFSRYLERRGEAGSLVFTHGCMPVVGLGSPECQTFASSVVDYLERTPQIRNVALVSIWRQPIEGDFLEGPDGVPLQGDARLRAFHRQFHATLERLRKSGKTIVLWEPLPAARKSVPKALAWSRIKGENPGVATTKQEHERKFRFMANAVSVNRELLKATISPATLLCPRNECLLESDGIPLYYDNNHPSRSSSAFFARLIESQLDGVM
jgi:peptidoglycan/LPS O-acetylase OafA/YrhL